MTLHTLLSPSVPALAPADTVGRALRLMADDGVQHLPVVGSDGRLLNVVAERELHAQPDPEMPLVALPAGEPVVAPPDAHVFDAAHLMGTHELSVLPVVGPDGLYLGAVTRQALFGRLAHMLATEEPGAIIVVETPRRDFSLAQLAYLVEQSDVRVRSATVEEDPATDVLRATLKLNVADTARVRALMEHSGYRIAAVFDEADPDLEYRAAAFLKYLEV